MKTAALCVTLAAGLLFALAWGLQSGTDSQDAVQGEEQAALERARMARIRQAAQDAPSQAPGKQAYNHSADGDDDADKDVGSPDALKVAEQHDQEFESTTAFSMPAVVPPEDYETASQTEDGDEDKGRKSKRHKRRRGRYKDRPGQALPGVEDGDIATEEVEPEPQPAVCQTDAECEPTENCWNGLCQNGVKNCQKDEQCQTGMRCQRGICSPGSRECEADDQCIEGYGCRFGVCEKLSEDCEIDEDCGDDARCIFKRCVQGTRQCSRDNDCPGGERCMATQCVPGERECLVDDECADGQRCGAGTCRDGERQCGADHECGTDARCHIGECFPGVRQCNYQSDCTSDKRCFMGECVDKV